MITKKDVLTIASLARIHLKEQEVEPLQKNLESILQYVAKLETLDVQTIQPTSHIFPVQNVFREDTVRDSLGQKKAVKIAIEQHNGFFKVPKVIE